MTHVLAPRSPSRRGTIEGSRLPAETWRRDTRTRPWMRGASILALLWLGACNPPCVRHSDCGGGYRCVQATCVVRVDPDADAGDAGSVDAGAMDADAMDADAMDADAMDADAMDADTMDADAMDAPTDASLEDGAVDDAGHTESGVDDAGPAEGGVDDAGHAVDGGGASGA